MITPLQVDQLTRDTYSEFDAVVIAQLAPMAYDSCYKPRLYKAPDAAQEVIGAGKKAQYGLSITPGALIYGIYDQDATGYMVQVTDLSLDHRLFAQPVPVELLNNIVKTVGYPNLWDAPHPVVGSGLFLVEIWNNTSGPLRIELVFGCLEPTE
jgi:hypothetical protein